MLGVGSDVTGREFIELRFGVNPPRAGGVLQQRFILHFIAVRLTEVVQRIRHRMFVD